MADEAGRLQWSDLGKPFRPLIPGALRGGGDVDQDGIPNRKDLDWIGRDRKGLNKLFSNESVQLQRLLEAEAAQRYRDLLEGKRFGPTEQQVMDMVAAQTAPAAGQAAAQQQALAQAQLASGGQQAGQFAEASGSLMQMLQDQQIRAIGAGNQAAMQERQAERADVRDRVLLMAQQQQERRQRQIKAVADAILIVMSGAPDIAGLFGGTFGSNQVAPDTGPAPANLATTAASAAGGAGGAGGTSGP